MGATRPADVWLDRLNENGRLILPLTASEFPNTDFRKGAIALISHAPPFGLTTLKAEQRRLTERLQRFGVCRDATLWERSAEALAII